ncbi:UNVERIFIED_CONTAM: hypothetical protein Scaly_3150800 [Sesamum calycinum]|uniref:Ty3-gypsy retrotransposon protein n=1 Tax=Sesamum calycinum TaxID=2727403 RepID=A0AAW2JFA4_9LAMI
MSKKAYPEVIFRETIEKDLLYLGGINEDDGDLKDDSSSSTPRSTSSVAPVMEFIMGTIQNKLGGNFKSSMTYTKQYTQRIDNLKMPVGYQSLKFQQFDGNGNPKQHVTHFIETCNNAGTYGDHLVKQSDP